MSRIRTNPPGVDPRLLIKDAAMLMPAPTRRLFLRGGASLGALAFLSGCDIIDGPSAEQALTKISYLNDRAQAWLFNPNKLAPTYPESAITRPFPFNGYYPEDEAPEVVRAVHEGRQDHQSPYQRGGQRERGADDRDGQEQQRDRHGDGRDESYEQRLPW